jgi:hypothetical protein
MYVSMKDKLNLFIHANDTQQNVTCRNYLNLYFRFEFPKLQFYDSEKRRSELKNVQ